MLKIGFVCGSLEPGKDGVGDQTRRLAGELINRGYDCRLVALHDPFVNEVQGNQGPLLQDSVPILRLPQSEQWKSKIKLTRKWLEDFDPDWISLQFVPYSFHSKGFPFQLPALFHSLRGNAKLQFMFHELWLDEPTGIRQQLLKFLQRTAIKKLIQISSPSVIHATIPLNQERLASIGTKSELLEIFGNLPVSEHAEIPYCFRNSIKEATQWIVYFGAAPREPFSSLIVSGLVEQISRNEQKLGLLIFAGNGDAKKPFIENLQKEKKLKDLIIADCGFVEAGALSAALLKCSVGIVRSSPRLLGKSSSAIAMLEHGLPIWLPKGGNVEPIELDYCQGHVHFDLGTALSQANSVRREIPPPRLISIVKKFILDLQSHS